MAQSTVDLSLGNEEDFGLSSDDDADLVALTASIEVLTDGIKRKGAFIEDASTTKRPEIGAYPTTSSLAVTTLTQNFGLKEFRLKQEAAIARILAGGSAVVVFPTGGGKSLCYQVPALTFSEIDKLENVRRKGDGGITLVVSPLIALMKDQVDALFRLGIRAAVMDSTKSREEYLKTCDALRDGTLKLLYCAPERLNNEGFVEHMKNVRGGIRLVAVDEAHCISEWGHSFRPDYLKVARFVKEIKAERVICLTATATPRVADDIREAFDIDKSGLFRTSAYRSNLRLLAESAKRKDDLYPKLFNFLRSNPGPSIVYVTLQRQTEFLAEDLQEHGFKAKSFHAGMQTAEKTKIQDEFMASNDLVIVATIAFGMGIDKASIRNVVHFNIPSSVESYSQEIGRAGRDGQEAKCQFFLCGDDYYLRNIFAYAELPSRESLRKLLADIFSPTNIKLGIGETFQASHYDQERRFDMRSTTVDNIYAQLEMRFDLIRAITPQYSKYSYVASGRYPSTLASDQSAAAKAINVFAQQAKTLHHIDLNAVTRSTGIPRADMVRKLNHWNDHEIIELRVAGVLNVYRVTQKLPSTPAEVEHLVQELYSHMEAREQQALNRTDQVIGLITGKSCFSKALATHFGDDLPSGKTECGHCTWCLTHKSVPLQRLPLVGFNDGAFQRILERVPDRDDARFLARVAFGITSPRVVAMKLKDHPVFGSMNEHDFMTLLAQFTSECSRANQLPVSARSEPHNPVPATKPASSKSSSGKTSSAKTSSYGPNGSSGRGGRGKGTDRGKRSG